jgi:hypothetical protein
MAAFNKAAQNLSEGVKACPKQTFSQATTVTHSRQRSAPRNPFARLERPAQTQCQDAEQIFEPFFVSQARRFQTKTARFQTPETSLDFPPHPVSREQIQRQIPGSDQNQTFVCRQADGGDFHRHLPDSCRSVPIVFNANRQRTNARAAFSHFAVRFKRRVEPRPQTKANSLFAQITVKPPSVKFSVGSQVTDPDGGKQLQKLVQNRLALLKAAGSDLRQNVTQQWNRHAVISDAQDQHISIDAMGCAIPSDPA